MPRKTQGELLRDLTDQVNRLTGRVEADRRAFDDLTSRVQRLEDQVTDLRMKVNSLDEFRTRREDTRRWYWSLVAPIFAAPCSEPFSDTFSAIEPRTHHDRPQ